MKITAVEEYGLRCFLRVVSYTEGNPVSAGEIAEAEGLSVPYTQKLLRLLSKAGLVESKRGSKGGYYVERDGEEITVGEVIRGLDGFIEVEKFCQEHTGNLDQCKHQCNCTIRPVWAHMSKVMMKMLDEIPLSLLKSDESRVGAYLNGLYEINDGDGPRMENIEDENRVVESAT